ncbi:MAG: hypothetical protein N2036_15020 [Bryobacteraceae bacterium]|nr:hypothetical protein [Bryobacteraceae bacterium]MCX7605386.1 hypothetical protein [Bryobacteraceae bacterium]
MPRRSVILLAAAWLTAAAQTASLPRGGDLGREWQVEEWNSTSLVLRGKWVREGDSARFRAFYSDAKGRPATWTVEIVAIEGNQVRLKILMPLRGEIRTYSATGEIQSDGRTIRGKAEWCGRAVSCGFRAVTDWKPAAKGVAQVAATAAVPRPSGGDRTDVVRAHPGRLWRVIDRTTPGYEWEGTWTFEGRTVRFAYRDRKSGARAEGTMELQAWDGAYVRLYNQGAGGTYEGSVQPDGRTVRGTARPCGNDGACRWEAVIEK